MVGSRRTRAVKVNEAGEKKAQVTAKSRSRSATASKAVTVGKTKRKATKEPPKKAKVRKEKTAKDVSNEDTDDESIVSKAALSKMTVVVLKKELGKRGLTISGRKADLVDRLLESMQLSANSSRQEPGKEQKPSISDIPDDRKKGKKKSGPANAQAKVEAFLWKGKPVDKMTVANLKATLKERGLHTNGLKAVLLARLKESLSKEFESISDAETVLGTDPNADSQPAKVGPTSASKKSGPKSRTPMQAASNTSAPVKPQSSSVDKRTGPKSRRFSVSSLGRRMSTGPRSRRAPTPVANSLPGSLGRSPFRLTGPRSSSKQVEESESDGQAVQVVDQNSDSEIETTSPVVLFVGEPRSKKRAAEVTVQRTGPRSRKRVAISVTDSGAGKDIPMDADAGQAALLDEERIASNSALSSGEEDPPQLEQEEEDENKGQGYTTEDQHEADQGDTEEEEDDEGDDGDDDDDDEVESLVTADEGDGQGPSLPQRPVSHVAENNAMEPDSDSEDDQASLEKAAEDAFIVILVEKLHTATAIDLKNALTTLGVKSKPRKKTEMAELVAEFYLENQGTLKVSEIKVVLRLLGLSLGGNKNELLKRLDRTLKSSEAPDSDDDAGALEHKAGPEKGQDKSGIKVDSGEVESSKEESADGNGEEDTPTDVEVEPGSENDQLSQAEQDSVTIDARDAYVSSTLMSRGHAMLPSPEKTKSPSQPSISSSPGRQPSNVLSPEFVSTTLMSRRKAPQEKPAPETVAPVVEILEEKQSPLPHTKRKSSGKKAARQVKKTTPRTTRSSGQKPESKESAAMYLVEEEVLEKPVGAQPDKKDDEQEKRAIEARSQTNELVNGGGEVDLEKLADFHGISLDNADPEELRKFYRVLDVLAGVDEEKAAARERERANRKRIKSEKKLLKSARKAEKREKKRLSKIAKSEAKKSRKKRKTIGIEGSEFVTMEKSYVAETPLASSSNSTSNGERSPKFRESLLSQGSADANYDESTAGQAAAEKVIETGSIPPSPFAAALRGHYTLGSSAPGQAAAPLIPSVRSFDPFVRKAPTPYGAPNGGGARPYTASMPRFGAPVPSSLPYTMSRRHPYGSAAPDQESGSRHASTSAQRVGRLIRESMDEGDLERLRKVERERACSNRFSSLGPVGSVADGKARGFSSSLGKYLESSSTKNQPSATEHSELAHTESATPLREIDKNSGGSSTLRTTPKFVFSPALESKPHANNEKFLGDIEKRKIKFAF